MARKPKRFLSNNIKGFEFDITGCKEIKIMSYRVRKRICPRQHLVMIHSEYVVGKLVWNFEWSKFGWRRCRFK